MNKRKVCLWRCRDIYIGSSVVLRYGVSRFSDTALVVCDKQSSKYRIFSDTYGSFRLQILEFSLYTTAALYQGVAKM